MEISFFLFFFFLLRHIIITYKQKIKKQHAKNTARYKATEDIPGLTSLYIQQARLKCKRNSRIKRDRKRKKRKEVKKYNFLNVPRLHEDIK